MGKVKREVYNVLSTTTQKCNMDDCKLPEKDRYYGADSADDRDAHDQREKSSHPRKAEEPQNGR